MKKKFYKNFEFKNHDVLVQYNGFSEDRHEVIIRTFYGSNDEGFESQETNAEFEDLNTALDYVQNFTNTMAENFLDRFLPVNQ